MDKNKPTVDNQKNEKHSEYEQGRKTIQRGSRSKSGKMREYQLGEIKTSREYSRVGRISTMIWRCSRGASEK
jgi:hypothetical protein